MKGFRKILSHGATKSIAYFFWIRCLSTLGLHTYGWEKIISRAYPGLELPSFDMQLLDLKACWSLQSLERLPCRTNPREILKSFTRISINFLCVVLQQLFAILGVLNFRYLYVFCRIVITVQPPAPLSALEEVQSSDNSPLSSLDAYPVMKAEPSPFSSKPVMFETEEVSAFRYFGPVLVNCFAQTPKGVLLGVG